MDAILTARLAAMLNIFTLACTTQLQIRYIRLPLCRPLLDGRMLSFSKDMRKQLTLGLFFITSSGQQYQTHNQVVEVKPFGRASKRGVDHLE